MWLVSVKSNQAETESVFTGRLLPGKGMTVTDTERRCVTPGLIFTGNTGELTAESYRQTQIQMGRRRVYSSKRSMRQNVRW